MARTRNRNRDTTRTWLPFLLALTGIVDCQRAFSKTPASESTTLTNGIRVIAVNIPGSTNLSLFTYLPMSLTSDGPHEGQWSHLVEHLVIRSTVPADFRIANAETLPDHMRLDFYGSTSNWREGLKLTANWLRGVPFTQAILNAEKPKVNSECDFTVKNFATHKFALAAWAQGYRHDLTHAELKGDVEKATVAELQKYRDERLVVLSNVVVCAVGGVETGALLASFSDEFRAIQSTASPIPPVQTHPHNRNMTWDLNARHLFMTWPIPSADRDDYAAFMVAGQWLNMQFFADAEMKKLTGMAFAGTDLVTPEGNHFFISASLLPEASYQDVRGCIERQLQRLQSDKEDLPQASMMGKQMSAQLTQLPDLDLMKSQLPPNMTPAMIEMNLGLQWGMNEYRYGKQKMVLARKLGSVDAAGIRQAAQKHLTGNQCTEVTLRPVGTEEPAAARPR